jgi:RNA polymerase sigma-70 factor (ECF subfamily)
MNNDEIIKLFCERDEGAINALSEFCGAKMKAVAMNVLHNEQDADECVNDAYLVLWNSIAEKKPDDISAFACGVVHNVAMKRYRYNTAEKRNAVTVSLDAELSEVISDNDDESDGLTDAVNGFLKTLSKSNRIIFMRRYYYGDSVSDISQISGMRENTVSARLLRIRKKLAEHLKKEGYRI